MDGVIVLVVVALVLFGSTQIPKLARSLGSAQKEFKQGLAEGDTGKATTPAVPVAPTVVVSTPAPVVTEAPPGATVHTA